jgi:hypothetical protein
MPLVRRLIIGRTITQGGLGPSHQADAIQRGPNSREQRVGIGSIHEQVGIVTIEQCDLMSIIDAHTGIGDGLGQRLLERVDWCKVILSESEVHDDRLRNIQVNIRLIDHGVIQDTDRAGRIV